MQAPDLHVHSGYSLYDGLGSPQGVVDRAVELGWSAVALTEHGWLGSAPALYAAAKKAGIKPIIGCELYVTPEDDLIDGDKTVLQNRRHLTVLALSFEGYQNLVTWQNASMQRPLYYNGARLSLERMGELAPHPLTHNVVLSGCLGGELCQCLLHSNGSGNALAGLYLDTARSIFPNFYVEVMNHAHRRFVGRGLSTYNAIVADQERVRDTLLALARDLRIPVIVTNDSHYQSPEQRKAHIAMMARKQARRTREAHEGATSLSTSNEFAQQYGYWMNFMRPMEEVADTLPDWAAKESIESIHAIVEEASVVLDPLDSFSYTLPSSGHDDPIDQIRRRSTRRLKTLVQRHGAIANERFNYELSAMGEFAHYLLIYADIVKMCRASGIYTWTRGSAANSLVNFCLGIHDIDPIHYKLMFERFVNPARAKFPDVDIDIEGWRQPDVARMVSEHMETIEGAGNVVRIAALGTVSNRKAFRLMAEAAGVPQERIDELAKLLPQMIDSGMAASDEEAYELIKEELGLDLHEQASMVFDQIGTVSQHACAFALGTRERPLSEWVPQYRIGSSDELVTQYDMKWIEQLGFLKLDLLKLETLTIMHRVARMLGKDFTWLDEICQPEPGVYELDEPSLEMIRQGRTEGVHSFQGATQRRGGIEVGVESVDEMVAVQALYRPSGTRTGNDKHYVARKHGREDWQSVNEFAAQFLDESYGFAIYQEQIMEMGAAMGMTGAEIDDLYKAIKTAKGMGRGAKELFEQFEPTFRRYADRHFSSEEADAIWQQWDQLQGYTFNRGHATSYAILAAKTAWVKQHYPREFFIALLESFPDNPRYVAAAISEGFQFEPPDVNTSGGGFSRGSHDKAIRVGLQRIRGVGPGAVSEIVRNQPFASVEDIKERCNGQRVKVPTVAALTAIGALASLGIEAEDDDLTQFQLLDFVLNRPKAFDGCAPQLGRRGFSSWTFEGLNDGVKFTEGKAFCAKLFWIPPIDKLYVKKTSPNGHYNAHLLTAIDVNGIPFQIRVPEKKTHESNILLALEELPGAVICAEGQVCMPFERGDPTGFKLWGITGAENGNPQIWNADEMKVAYIVKTAKEKRRSQ